MLHQVDLTSLVQGRTIENIVFGFSAPQVRAVQWRTLHLLTALCRISR